LHATKNAIEENQKELEQTVRLMKQLLDSQYNLNTQIINFKK